VGTVGPFFSGFMGSYGFWVTSNLFTALVMISVATFIQVATPEHALTILLCQSPGISFFFVSDIGYLEIDSIVSHFSQLSVNAFIKSKQPVFHKLSFPKSEI